jgi:hypothetical protein
MILDPRRQFVDSTLLASAKHRHEDRARSRALFSLLPEFLPAVIFSLVTRRGFSAANTPFHYS